MVRRALLGTSALVALPLAMLAASSTLHAQQYFNGTQTTPNNAINGGTGPWDTTTTNWTNATGTASSTYNSTAATVTVFGSSGTLTPLTGGNVTVPAGGIQLTGMVQIRPTGDNSGYNFNGGNVGALTTAIGGTTFDVANFRSQIYPEADISSSIVGANGITKTGAGLLGLAVPNSYTGNTIITAGIVTFVGANATLGSTANSVTVNGATAVLSLNATTQTQNGGVLLDGGGTIGGGTLSSSGTFDLRSGLVDTTLAGSGGVVKSTAGTVTFYRSNTYTGNTLITAGTLVLVNAGHVMMGNTANSTTLNGASAALDLGGTAQIQNGGVSLQDGTIQNGTLSSTGTFDLRSGTVSASLAGTGGVTKTTAGTVTLSGANSYSGGTVISDGTLQVTNNSAVSAGTVTLDGGSFQAGAQGLNFSNTFKLNPTGGFVDTNGNTLIISGNMVDGSGAGGFTKVGAGVLTLSGASTYTGPTQISAGSVRAGGAGAFAATSAFNLAAGTALDLNGFSQTIGSLAGSGNVTFGSGTLTTGGNNAGSTFSGVMSGSGGLIKIGSGTFLLSGGNNYAGATNINAGALRAGAVGTFAQSSAFSIAAGAMLDLNGFDQTIGSLAGAGSVTLGTAALATGADNTSTTFSGVVSGAGSLTKIGAGALTLSATNAYTGATTVNAGTLSVNGSIASSSGLTVNAGGTIGGNGTLPKTTINGGTLSPGNSIGTITVSGSLTFVGAGNYLVEVSGANSDRTVVTGTASLAGKVSVAPLTPVTARTTYTILTAVGLTGTFGSAEMVNSFGRNPQLSYTANGVSMTVDPNLLGPILPSFVSANQKSVAGAIDLGILNTGNLSFPALFALPASQLPAALDQLSGEVHASTVGVLADESLYLRSAVLGRLRQASYGGDMGAMAALKVGGPQAFAGDEELNSALAYAKAPMRAPQVSSDVVFWAQGFGAWGRFNTDGNAATVRRDLAGFISGVDTRVGSNGRLGIAAGYTGSRNSLDGRGSANVESGHVAGYGGWSFGALNLRAGGAYAFHNIDTDRTINFPGFFDRATARYDGNTGQIFGEAGYGFAFNNIAVEPFAGGAWVRVKTDAAAERGGLAALNVAASTFEVGYSTLGARAASMIPLGDGMVLIPRASAAWQHAFNTVTPTTILAFQIAPVPFVIAGVPIARDSLLAEAGLDLAIGRHATLGVSYVGQLASNVQDHAAKGRFSWKF
jgi:outer membrane autotransporter protein